MDRQSKKNISITLVFMLVLLIGIVFIFVFPNMFTKYKLIKLINNTIENEKLSAYANISLSINDDDYNLEFELNSTKIKLFYIFFYYFVNKTLFLTYYLV